MTAWSHNSHYHARILAQCPARCERALDVGCGSGELTRELARVADHVIGLDADRAMIDRARARDPSLDWRCGDFLDAMLPPVDFMVFVASLHHMNMRVAIGRALGALRPGGVLCVLGLARSTRPKDWIMDAGGLVASQVIRRRRPCALPSGARIVDPSVSYASVRSLARELPRSRYQRLLLFRYLLTIRA